MMKWLNHLKAMKTLNSRLLERLFRSITLAPRPSSLVPLSLFPLFLLSCNSTEKQPQLPIPQEQMVGIMVDLHLVETAHNMKLTEGDSTRPDYAQLNERVFAKHGITKTAFDSALYTYSFHPQEMNTVYDLVLERLSEMDAEIQAEKAE